MSDTDDTRRVKFYDDHLQAVARPHKQGADVRCLFAWSLLDNYEWGEGYQSSRLGIVEVDYETQKRTTQVRLQRFRAQAAQ